MTQKLSVTPPGDVPSSRSTSILRKSSLASQLHTGRRKTECQPASKGRRKAQRLSGADPGSNLRPQKLNSIGIQQLPSMEHESKDSHAASPRERATLASSQSPHMATRYDLPVICLQKGEGKRYWFSTLSLTIKQLGEDRGLNGDAKKMQKKASPVGSEEAGDADTTTKPVLEPRLRNQVPDEEAKGREPRSVGSLALRSPAGDTALRAEAAPGDSGGLKTLPPGVQQVMPESECHQNGMLVVSQPHPVQQYDEVDLGASVREDHAATASPTTTEISTAADASGKSLGKEAKPQAPAARSRFFLTLSRPVPGRAGDQATDSSTGSVKLDVSSSQAPRNKDLSEPGALPGAAAPGRDPDKTPGPTPAAQLGLSATWGPESGGAAPSKPKDPSFFDKLFKLDKEREQTPVDSQQEAKCAQHQDQARETPGSSTQSSDVPAEGDIADGRRREGQEITTVSCSVPGDPEELETAKEDPQTENNNSIMSFFKTLASKAESVCDGQAGQKTAESQAKGAKKKHLHSPRLGLAFRKFFRHKDAEKSPTTPADIKSDQAHVTPQEPQGAAKNSTSTEAAKEGAKEKGGPTSLPLGKLFWKKDPIPDMEEAALSPLQRLAITAYPSAGAMRNWNLGWLVPQLVGVLLCGKDEEKRKQLSEATSSVIVC
ncbi:breast carcinoma-amplified sequence 1-like protein [Camelus ferus]|nr:breast carcinoma-amplified sequence 1-like protein [Camelus ferus]